jgi:hypothetical protein
VASSEVEKFMTEIAIAIAGALVGSFVTFDFLVSRSGATAVMWPCDDPWSPMEISVLIGD